MAALNCSFYIDSSGSLVALCQRDIQRGNMKPVSIAGIVLIVLGIFALAYQGITYTKRERIVDVGPIHATKDTQKTIPLPPIVGGIALIGGIALLAVGGKKTE